MCVVSMIMDRGLQDLSEPLVNSNEFLRKFQKDLEAAKIYDKKNNEPECESEDKIKKLLEVADKLGIKEQVEKVIKQTIQEHIEKI